MSDHVLHIIGAAVGEGASDGGCKWGAAALKDHGMARALSATGPVSYTHLTLPTICSV